MAIAPPEPRWRRHGAIRAAELAEHPLILFDRGGTVRREIDAWFARARVTARARRSLVRHIGLVRRRDKPVAPPLAAFLDTLEDLRTALARRRRL